MVNIFAVKTSFNDNQTAFNNTLNHPSDDFFSLIGNTPLIRIRMPFLNNINTKVYAKLEMFNFGGSIKDRPAYWMIKEAERKGILKPTNTIIEPTSGNTGIGLAWIGQKKGYKVILVMPESVSNERKAIIKSYGAKIIETPEKEKMEGAINKSRELIKSNSNLIMLDQFSNSANKMSHYESTGPEIWNQTNNKVDYLIAVTGTSGTLMGTSLFLRSKNPKIKTIGIEPYPNEKIPGLKNMATSEIPKIYRPEILDKVVFVTKKESILMVKELAKKNALLVGPSSGAALIGIKKFIKNNLEEIEGKTIVTIFPDGGLKYLSLGFFQ